MKKTVSVSTEVEVEVDINEFDDEVIRAEFEDRFGEQSPNLMQIYEEFARRGDAPQVLRDYLYEKIGRILP
jgi:hypothetical protein